MVKFSCLIASSSLIPSSVVLGLPMSLLSTFFIDVIREFLFVCLAFHLTLSYNFHLSAKILHTSSCVWSSFPPEPLAYESLLFKNISLTVTTSEPFESGSVDRSLCLLKMVCLLSLLCFAHYFSLNARFMCRRVRLR